ncbi:MAG: hypothetical protein ABSD59_01075 [Terracidiphilus sp.]|jgi:hypothetical protein
MHEEPGEFRKTWIARDSPPYFGTAISGRLLDMPSSWRSMHDQQELGLLEFLAEQPAKFRARAAHSVRTKMLDADCPCSR